MRTIRRSDSFRRACSPRRLVLLIVGCLLATPPGGSQADDDPQAGEAGRRVLFDGTSLEGWKKADFLGAAEARVDDGSIILPEGRPMSGITSTLDDLPKRDYELRYEAMRLSGSDFFAAATFPVGDSFITLVNGGWGGNVTGLSSLDGADASENETNKYVKYCDKTWYRFRVRVTDDVIRCWLDDEEIVAVKHRGRQVRTRIETRRNQPLGFATYESGGAIRKIDVRPLTPAEVEANNKIEE